MQNISYARYRFPPVIIQHAVWLYFRFPLSFRDVEDLLAERGIDASYESVRRWSVTFGLTYGFDMALSEENFEDLRWLWKLLDQSGKIYGNQWRQNTKFAWGQSIRHFSDNAAPTLCGLKICLRGQTETRSR